MPQKSSIFSRNITSYYNVNQITICLIIIIISWQDKIRGALIFIGNDSSSVEKIMSTQEFNKIKHELKQTKDVYSTLSEVRYLIIYIVSASCNVKVTDFIFQNVGTGIAEKP